MDEAQVEAVRKAYQRVVCVSNLATVPVPPPDWDDVLRAARFMLRCRVRRMYATVERISDKHGTTSPFVLVKAELAEGRQRRTVLMGAPVEEQLLRAHSTNSAPPRWYELLGPELAKALPARAKELRDVLQRQVEAFKGDPEARASVERRVASIAEDVRQKAARDLASQFRSLLRQGWTEADVLGVWKEAVCSEVMEA